MHMGRFELTPVNLEERESARERQGEGDNK